MAAQKVVVEWKTKSSKPLTEEQMEAIRTLKINMVDSMTQTIQGNQIARDAISRFQGAQGLIHQMVLESSQDDQKKGTQAHKACFCGKPDCECNCQAAKTCYSCSRLREIARTTA